MLDRQLVEELAAELGTMPRMVEKDWHVVRALGVLSGIDHGDVRPVFSGGTSLSIGWGLIKRFSEDVDFKVAMPPAASRTAARNQRGDYREKILGALTASDYQLASQPRIENEGRHFSAELSYASAFDEAPALRPHLRVEMSFQPTVLGPIAHPIRSLLAKAQQHEPEVATFLCVDPVETAADKLSALAWRACARDRASKDDDPTIIRHLHDLAALEELVQKEIGFKTALAHALTADERRGGDAAPADPAERFAKMLGRLTDEPQWAVEYEQFVNAVSFASQEERISFDDAFAAARRLVEHYQASTKS